MTAWNRDRPGRHFRFPILGFWIQRQRPRAIRLRREIENRKSKIENVWWGAQDGIFDFRFWDFGFNGNGPEPARPGAPGRQIENRIPARRDKIENVSRTGRLTVVVPLSYATPLLSTLASGLYLGVRVGRGLWLACALVVAGAVLCRLAVREPPGDEAA